MTVGPFSEPSFTNALLPMKGPMQDMCFNEMRIVAYDCFQRRFLLAPKYVLKIRNKLVAI